MVSEHSDFFLLFKWHPQQQVVSAVVFSSKDFILTFNSLYIVCHHFLQMLKQKIRQPAIKNQRILKLDFLIYIIIQFIRMDYSVKIYFLPVAGDGGKNVIFQVIIFLEYIIRFQVMPAALLLFLLWTLDRQLRVVMPIRSTCLYILEVYLYL